MTTPPAGRFRWASFILIAMLLLAGCAPAATQPAATATRTAAPAASTTAPSATAAATSSPDAGKATATPGAAPVAATDVLYQDDFTNSTSGWPEAKFDNYFVGYHEPTYYHIEIDSPNYHATVFMPGKKPFDDATIQVQSLVNSKKTAATGDFAWGVAFRRSGDNYYAFVVSPRSQKWMLLKSSPNALVTLAQGSDTSLHAADVDDSLRVDAQGPVFSLHINGRLVAQVTDKDYASGEVGFYVQTYDAQQVHVHYDELTISAFEAPALCKVLPVKNGPNLRSGPGWGSSFVAPLFEGQSLEPLGHSADGTWLNVRVETSGQLGWVVSASSYVSCNVDLSALPIIVP
ncbi:MAG TPA: SH3 domain-containing protein [Anaerolineales bacterium]